MMPSEQSDPSSAATTFHSLGGAGKVWLCADACLALRPASSACSRCRDVCPVQAFEWTAEGVRLNACCTGCGQCAAACPSGAIRVAGFEPARLKSAVQRIECVRVPDHIAGDAAKVPCLGGLSSTVVLGLAASSPTPWRIMDRGWCATCEMGNGTAVIVDETLAFTDALLDTLGVPQERWPSILPEPLPASTSQPLKIPADSTSVNRRSFFSSLARIAEKATTHKAPVTVDRGGCKPSPVIQFHRKRFANAMWTFANEVGGAVPASFFPVIEVAAHCDHQGLCAALCPSGALRRYDDEVNGIVGLHFDAQMCVACGLCASLCPSGAIRLLPVGNEEAIASGSVQTLTKHTRKICSQCSSPFVSAGSSDLCSHCGTDRQLMFSLFGTKHANRSVSD